MRKDIYHYYFEFDKGLIEVVKEQYEDGVEPKNGVFNPDAAKYGPNGYIRLFTRGENNHCKVIDKRDIGVAINGKYVLLYERDDEKARQIFLDYLDQDIKKQHKRLSRFIEKYDMFSTLEMTGGNL